MAGRWLAVALVCGVTAGCFGGDDGDAPFMLETFAFGTQQFAMRPGGCWNVGIAIRAQGKGAESLTADVTIDGPGVLFDPAPGGGERALFICSKYMQGSGKLVATLKGGDGRTTQAKYDVVRPGPEYDHTAVLHPTKLFGRQAGVPTSIEWSADDTKIYISYDTGVFTEWDATTLLPLRAWLGLGERTKLLDDHYAVSMIDATYVFDLDGGTARTWIAGPISYWGSPAIQYPVAFKTRAATGLGNIVVSGDSDSPGCAIGYADFSTGEHVLMGSLETGGQDGFVTPRANVLQMSPNSRYIAWGGKLGCDTPGDDVSGPPQVYDRQEKKLIGCGQLDTAANPANSTGVNFSADGSIFAWSQTNHVTIMKMPECTDYGHGIEEFPLHSQLAVAPDGQHVAFINDYGPQPQVRHIDISANSPQRHPSDFNETTLTLGGELQVYVRQTPHYVDDPFPGEHQTLAYSHDGKHIAVGHLGGGVSVVDIEPGTVRTDTQAPYIGGTPTLAMVSPDGNYAALGGLGSEHVVVALADGHRIYTTAANEDVLDVRDDGFVLGLLGNASDLVAYDGVTRTPLDMPYTPAPRDYSSPGAHNSCQLEGGAQLQLCINSATHQAISCVDYDMTMFGQQPNAPLMLDDTRCVFTAHDSLYEFVNNKIFRIAPDPTTGAFSHGGALYRGPNGTVISVGSSIAIWRPTF